jgi:23S rRNA (guanine2445-N2)-methyltransferase / 23S rRNA (guanine2069-N7)-methyltransferase
VVDACQVVFDIVDRDQIGLKRRERQRGTRQYERVSQRGERSQITELGARLWVNLHDYLDTGLFLDHRPIRRKIQSEVRGKRFLNLFSYTGVASVQAALGGARYTTSVDLSNTYLNWFKENLASNGLAESQNRAIRADVMAWLEQEESVYDIILLDPPTFSNSKATEQHFDVQRDHPALITRAMARLDQEGVLYFSNNHRKFELDDELTIGFAVEEITQSTIDPDFQRSAGIHRCWAIRHIPQTIK